MMTDGNSGQTTVWIGRKRRWTVMGSSAIVGASQQWQLHVLIGSKGIVLMVVCNNCGLRWASVRWGDSGFK